MSEPLSLDFQAIGLHEAKRFVGQHHYARHSPPHCLEALGLHSNGQLVAASLWGWGVRPRHTIQRLFPSLGTADYRELNRLCVRDDQAHNTASYFLATCIRWFRHNRPDIKVLISWADGMRGKPGFIYQATNWLYTGFIETEFYVTKEHEVVHPRQITTRYGHRDKAFTDSIGIQKAHGRQFLYVMFLCGKRERKALIRESSSSFSTDYPKLEDCLLWYAGKGSRETRQATSLKSAVRFRIPASQLPIEELFNGE